MNNTKNEIEVERIENISRKKTTNIPIPEFRKLKLNSINIDSSYKYIYNKYSRYFSSKIKEYLLNKSMNIWELSSDDFIQMIKTILPCPIDIEPIEIVSKDSETFTVAKLSCKDVNTDESVKDENLICYSLCITGQEDNIGSIVIPIPVNTDIVVNKKLRKAIYYISRSKNKNKEKIISIEDLLAYLFITETTFSKLRELLKVSNNKYQTTYYRCYFSNNTITDEDIDTLSYQNNKSFGWHPMFGRALISEIFAYLKDEDEEKYLESEFNRKLSDDYATSYQDKKNPTDKIIKKMKNNSFNPYFKKVEIDSDVDLDKFYQIEEEWENFSKSSLLKLINLLKEKPTLRFRKLGQHNATGLYYPHVNCICVDIRDISSFIHELGHCIDYTLGEDRLSKHYKFKRVISNYKYYFEKQLITSNSKHLKNKKQYFFQATEIFARSFEQYLGIKKGLKSSFLPEKYEQERGFIEFEKMSKYIVEYFDDLFKKYDIDIPEGLSTLNINTNLRFETMNIKEIEDTSLVNKEEKKKILDSKKENSNIKKNIEYKKIIEISSDDSEEDINQNLKESEKDEVKLFVYNDKKNRNQLSLFNFN